MDKETRKSIYREIKASTIPEELKICYLLAEATSIMSARSFERIKTVFRRHGFDARENDLLTGIAEYSKLVQRAEGEFFRRVDPQIMGATFDPESGEGVKNYDGFSADANEICRLLMLYVDRKLPEGGLITDEDVARYRQK